MHKMHTCMQVHELANISVRDMARRGRGCGQAWVLAWQESAHHSGPIWLTVQPRVMVGTCDLVGGATVKESDGHWFDSSHQPF